MPRNPLNFFGALISHRKSAYSHYNTKTWSWNVCNPPAVHSNV